MTISISIPLFLLLITLTFLTTNTDAFSTSPKSCECVTFRMDDIQDFFLNDVQMAVMDTFLDNNASLTLGIIGAHFGEDDALVKYISDNLQVNANTTGSQPAILQIANHGWEHEDFTEYNMSNQSSLIKRANERISFILGVTPVVFIPPFNMVNNDTFSSLIENRVSYVSANVTTDPPSIYSEKSYQNKTSDSLYHFPSSGNTGDLSTNNDYWEGREHQQVLSDIELSLNNYGFAVVTLHPMEYSQREALDYSNSVDLHQLSELKKLINGIRELGLKIVTIPEIKSYMNVSTLVVFV